MSKASIMEKSEAMNMYAQGNSIKEISKEINYHEATIIGWKKNKDPEDWDTYAKEYAREILDTIRQKIRVDAADQMGKQWDDSKRLRDLGRTFLTAITKDMTEEVDGKLRLKDKIDLTSCVWSGQRITQIFEKIQTQQLHLIGLPNIRIDKSPPKSPIARSLTDEELSAMDDIEIIKALLQESSHSTDDESE